jgi:hypothetical protein
MYVLCYIIIITAGAQAFLMDYTLRRTGHNPPRGPSAGWWVLTTANAAKTNSLTCLPKHGGARDNKVLVTHLITDQPCLISAIARRSALTVGPSSSSCIMLYTLLNVKKRSLSPVSVSCLSLLSLSRCVPPP